MDYSGAKSSEIIAIALNMRGQKALWTKPLWTKCNWPKIFGKRACQFFHFSTKILEKKPIYLQVIPTDVCAILLFRHSKWKEN